MEVVWVEKYDEVIIGALKEDILTYDLTTENIFSDNDKSTARIIAKQEGIIAGLEIFKRVFTIVDEVIEFSEFFKDGDKVKKGDVILEIEGSTKSMLKAERTALNFLQRLSGVATKTGLFCEKIEGMGVKVTDTRKTTPGLRMMEKYAVRVGGGSNHRFSLSDGVLIKDNHIKAAGGIKQAVSKVRKQIPHTVKIEVETESIEDVKQALEAGADIIMLDNMNTDTMANAVKLVDKRALVEASGNVSIDSIHDIAKTGVDIISIGSITHSVEALDISMRIK